MVRTLITVALKNRMVVLLVAAGLFAWGIYSINQLSANPVYQQYCPMKKASWLSNTKAIKNPYYGNAMLTCGSVKETF